MNELALPPSGILECIVDKEEVRILKASKEKLEIRSDVMVSDTSHIMVSFYDFDRNAYKEINIENYNIEKIEKRDFYYVCTLKIKDEDYKRNLMKIAYDYSRYVRLKNYGDDNEFSMEMTGYPAQLDYDFYDYYEDEKYDWLSQLKYEVLDKAVLDSLELAVTVDNNELYKKYLENSLSHFKNMYFKYNFIDGHEISKKDISRIYIGNEFCHNLFPNRDALMAMMDKAYGEGLKITICFTYMRECYIEKNSQIIDMLYAWCENHKEDIEIVINDYGMFALIDGKKDYLKPLLGVLLNKRRKDPRYMYKNGYSENQKMIKDNSLNGDIFSSFLNENGIYRYEYESCGYEMNIAPGRHSMHMPFYVTNISQYCPLYAMCTTMDRGHQLFVKKCPEYCRDYVFSYPKHLKMVGRYNSLFSFDDTLLRDGRMLQHYLHKGIDRIVLNFI